MPRLGAKTLAVGFAFYTCLCAKAAVKWQRRFSKAAKRIISIEAP